MSAATDIVADEALSALIANLAERLKVVDQTDRSAVSAGYRLAFEDAIRWTFHWRGPVGDDCTACGKLSPCIATGATGYPLCETCYRAACLELAGPG